MGPHPVCGRGAEAPSILTLPGTPDFALDAASAAVPVGHSGDVGTVGYALVYLVARVDELARQGTSRRQGEWSPASEPAAGRGVGPR